MTDPRDEPKLEPEQVSSSAVKALVALGLLFIVGVIVLLVVIIAQGVHRAAPAVKEGWQDITDIRSRDAATVTAQKKAGEAYLHNLALRLQAAPAPGQDGAFDAVLSGAITNNGDSRVIRAVAVVDFPAAEEGAVAERREIILFDASPLSVTTDRPLHPGETRPLRTTVTGVSERWVPASPLAASMLEARIEIEEDPAPAG